MDTLTDKERRGLEDVFLSIHSCNKESFLKRYCLPPFSLGTLFHKDGKSLSQRKKGTKTNKIGHFFAKNRAKKKNLSK